MATRTKTVNTIFKSKIDSITGAAPYLQSAVSPEGKTSSFALTNMR